MPEFSKSIISWYKKNHRDLPWRNTRNPYQIWLSEIILQQTKVDQGLAYYENFIRIYPDIRSLAEAEEQAVLKLWQGLGYYSRARNLHHTAKNILAEHGGIFPTNYVQIRSLKGVGDYTAAAIASFAFDLPHAVVDGNVFRVLSRVFNIDLPIDSGKAKKVFYQLANELLDKKDPATHNQGMMELGATICTPHNPKCNACPLHDKCIAREKDLITLLPVKKKKVKARERYIEYFVMQRNNRILFRKRGTDDIWANMFDFPSLEYSRDTEPEQVCESEEWSTYFRERKPKVENISVRYKHVLSHQIIHARFWKIKAPSAFNLKDAEYVSVSDIENYPLPRLIERYLEENM